MSNDPVSHWALAGGVLLPVWLADLAWLAPVLFGELPTAGASRRLITNC